MASATAGAMAGAMASARKAAKPSLVAMRATHFMPRTAIRALPAVQNTRATMKMPTIMKAITTLASRPAMMPSQVATPTRMALR